jgi:hypothetical protein
MRADNSLAPQAAPQPHEPSERAVFDQLTSEGAQTDEEQKL